MIYNPPPVQGRNIQIPIITPSKGTEFINHRFGLGDAGVRGAGRLPASCQQSASWQSTVLHLSKCLGLGVWGLRVSTRTV